MYIIKCVADMYIFIYVLEKVGLVFEIFLCEKYNIIYNWNCDIKFSLFQPMHLMGKWYL